MGGRWCAEPFTRAFEHITTLNEQLTVQQPLAEIELQQPEFFVGGIIKRKWNASSKEHLWLVTWDGYPASENSWEPESCFKTAHYQ